MKCLTCNKHFIINFKYTFDILRRNNIVLKKIDSTSLKATKGNKVFIISIEILCKECKDDCITKFLDEYYMAVYIESFSPRKIVQKYFVGYYSRNIIRELYLKSSFFSKKRWKAKSGSLSKLILKEF